MSPSRRQQFIPSRPRAEVYAAIAVGVGIVVGTLAIIWLIRPGKPGVPGGGGLLSRQPRMTILVLLVAGALASVIGFVVTRRHRPRFGARGSIAIGAALVVVLAVGGGIFWPGGVVRHWPSRPKIATTPTTNPVSVPSTTPPTTPATTSKATPTTPAPDATTTPSTASGSTSSTTGG